ncbi:MAG: hypothetical protein N2323_03340 [candidate division WOR-3 bacterium]|nr:hypothetical protein [candidate division WOR-3 bacterium]MCX7836975.1 hypothetical protein [candidate division WOR-3 bacterium]MDW8114103.1 hypothetical protein [candidate division WOR-3 bacterium]
MKFLTLCKNKLKNGILITIGYILSPFSWWNDIFVNIPIAYMFGFLFSLISSKLFLPITILFYWLTNFLGIILIQIGAINLLSKEKYTKRKLLIALFFPTFYTILIIFLFSFLKSPNLHNH